jgi:hypothetical protein
VSVSRFAFGGALDAAEGVGAQFVARAFFADAFGVGDRAQGGAGVDGGAGGVGRALGMLVACGGIVATWARSRSAAA